MPRQRENVQRARQLDQDVQPPDSSSPARSTTRPPHQPALFAPLLAFIREKGVEIYALPIRRTLFHVVSEVYALPLWRTLFYMVSIFLFLIFWDCVLNFCSNLIDQKVHCTSEWILDTTAPYHTTNQLCAFADKSAKNFSSPAPYKGVEAYGYGTVKLDLQYFNREVADAKGVSWGDGIHYAPVKLHRHPLTVSWDRLLRYTPLELHYTQYVPERANTISVSQLMQHNDGKTIPNEAVLRVSVSRDLTLHIGKVGNGTRVYAKNVNGHYVVNARVPRRSCRCPDRKERSIFKVSGS